MNLDASHLKLVERWTMGLAAAVIAVAGLFASRQMAFAVTLGAGLMALNAYAIRRIGQRVIRTFARPGAAVLLLNLKMLALVALVFVVVHYLRVDAVGFLIGISIFPVAVVASAIKIGLSEPEGGAHGEPNGEGT